MRKFIEIPSFGVAFSFEELNRTVQFGDGYRESAPDGINAKRLIAQVTFSRIRTQKAKRVLDFVRLVGTTEDFLWTAPEPWNDRQRAWHIQGPADHQKEAFDAENISMVFRQSFNPVTQLTAPGLSPDDGSPVAITIPPGAAVRYTITDGPEPTYPTDTTGTLYVGPIPYAQVDGKTLRAIAYQPGTGGAYDGTSFVMSSPIATGTY